MSNNSKNDPLNIQFFFDERTSTLTYVVNKKGESGCIVIDPVTDYDETSGRVYHESVEAVIKYIKENEYTVEWILETHAHADHLSGAPYIHRELGGNIGIGEHISKVQKIFRNTFNMSEDFADDGSQFSHLFKDGDKLQVSGMNIEILHVPGHTPADIAYVIEDSVFVGDTLFMPDGGSARADFPGGDAGSLFQSAKKILSFPEHYKIYVCHDYQPNGRELKFQTTVGEQRTSNIHLADGINESKFVEMRTNRDKTLGMPKLLIPSIQVNIRAGELPPAENNGIRYIKIPINQI